MHAGHESRGSLTRCPILGYPGHPSQDIAAQSLLASGVVQLSSSRHPEPAVLERLHPDLLYQIHPKGLRWLCPFGFHNKRYQETQALLHWNSKFLRTVRAHVREMAIEGDSDKASQRQCNKYEMTGYETMVAQAKRLVTIQGTPPLGGRCPSWLATF